MFIWHASLSYSYFIVKCSYSHILKYMVYKNCFHTHMVMCIAIKGKCRGSLPKQFLQYFC